MCRWPSAAACGQPLPTLRSCWRSARYALLARRIDQPAALLAVPEVAWTAFAAVLSTTVAAINSQ